MTIAPTPTQLGCPKEGEAAFFRLYEEQVDFAWRMVERLGVPLHAVEDAVQDVFLVVHRRLAEFRGESSVRTWVGGICIRVARDYRRSQSRKLAREEPAGAPELEEARPGPEAQLEHARDLALVRALLGQLPEEQREVFVMAECEGLTAPEISAATGAGLNTVYSRLRLGRARFEELVAAHRAREPRT